MRLVADVALAAALVAASLHSATAAFADSSVASCSSSEVGIPSALVAALGPYVRNAADTNAPRPPCTVVDGYRLCEYGLVLLQDGGANRLNLLRGEELVCALTTDSPSAGWTAIQGAQSTETMTGELTSLSPSSPELLLSGESQGFASGDPLAGSTISVFDSQDQSGTVPELPSFIGNGPTNSLLYLYIDVPGTPTSIGSVCVNGDGSEICGYDLIIEATGGVEFVAFTPASGIVGTSSQTRLRLNALHATTGLLGTSFVGSLEINTEGVQNGGVRLRDSEAIGAALWELPLAERSIAWVPEPTGGSLLAAGLVALVGLARRRGSH